MKKPKVKLTGKDSNVFTLLNFCSFALIKAGQKEQADELSSKVFNANSYNEALNLFREYCDVS